mmetsp:Transcript_11696/g.13008  ORF Transcript_11696/g.13008 Transcript_11696/m.13008 type:complete len:120 (-) Transcript_11696:107-466(-)
MFAFWAGWRGYHLTTSIQTEDVVEDIVAIPLCEGRSVVSDEICGDLITLVNHTISTDFWKNLDEENDNILHHEEIWKNVLKFIGNCEKRKAYEDVVRQRNNTSSEDSVVIPSPGVPDNF